MHLGAVARLKSAQRTLTDVEQIPEPVPSAYALHLAHISRLKQPFCNVILLFTLAKHELQPCGLLTVLKF